ncbi:condensin complex subunit 3 [Anopheles arabiensis]|uniref:Nuclear condensin complex subunit 3 C-terminal domain-containing protein n=1 Tax=Anopheles arabiensis TaxID=7173 RepID=A0A182I3I7_ANOAR|nr:condensin complex subunit 3 [Anopheles arabiensis]
MAPRKRKVVVAPANSPEKVKYSTAVIQTVLSAQQSETTHAKLVKQLKQLYSTVQHDSFMKSFVQVIKRQMEHEETNPYANNVLKFCAKFVADPEYSEQAVTHPIMASIFDWLLSTISSAQLVRFRICQLVNLILNALGSDAALDDTVCDKILRYMLERIRDVSQHVRVQAVLALQRLQDPNSPEDPVVRAYVYHLDKDPSPKVRQTIISALGRNYRLIPYVLERLWDVDERVRRHTYMQMSSYPVRHYKVEQRLKFLEQGLTDHSDGVRKVMRNVMIPQWIESYQRDYVGFVEALKLDADDKEMERFRKTSKLVLMEIFKKNGVKHMAQLLNFGEESKTVPLSELTIERAICWQAMLEHLQQSDSDEQEDYMIELSKFCEYIKALVENPTALAFMKANANVTASAIGSNQVAAVAASSPSQPETMDKLQQLYLQYILQILLEIVLMYDFGDEFGRDSLKQVLSHMLCQETLFEMNVRLIMETFEKIITDVESRLTFFVELVSSVLEPSRQDVSISSRQLIDTYLEKHPELTTLKIQISALRVKILELKEQESALSAQRDYAGAQRMNDELNMCNEKYANLVKPLIQEMSLTCASGSSIGDDTTNTTLLFRDSMLKPRRVTQATVEKCLQICFYLVNSPSVRVLTPPVCDLYRTFISRHVQSGQLSTRNWALRTSTAFSMLYDGLSKETFQLLYQQFLNTASSRLWKTAIECVFELLDKYGFEYFDLESEDAINTSKDDSRTQKSSRQLFSRQNSSYHDDLMQSSSCNGNEFYKMSVHFMDTCNDSVICSAIIEGFCRLILRGKCTSADIMSKLLLRFFNPTTEPEMQQMLGIFFQRLIAKRRQELMQKALLSTLFMVLEAPNESPLAEVRPETVIKFVVDSTQPVFCSPGVNPHNTIAVTFLRVMRDNITLKDLLKLLSKELLGLDIKDDPVLRNDLASTADEILKEPLLDPKTVKNLNTFRELMLGKIRETLTFSSSRAPVAADGEEGEEEEAAEAEPEAEGNDDDGKEEGPGDGEETEQEENEDEERSEERPLINKSILQEDSDTDLLASPMKQPGGGSLASPARDRTPRAAPGTPDSGVKSLRRSLLTNSANAAAATTTTATADSGNFKVPDASALRKIQAASARVREALSQSRSATASKGTDSEEDFEIPATNDGARRQPSSSSSSSDSEFEIPETQSPGDDAGAVDATPSPQPASARAAMRRKVSTTRSGARMASRKTSTPAARSVSTSSSSSSSSDCEAVDVSPNVTVSRINRNARPINKVAAKTLLERKKLAEAPMTMPRATRTAARREMANSKVMTRKSLSELNASAPGTGRSSATPTTPTSERRTGSKSRSKTTNEVNSPAKHNGTTAPRPSRRSNKAPDESETTVQSRTSLSPVRAVSTRRWVASTSASTGQQSDSPSGSKRTRGQRSVTTSTQQQSDSTTKTPTASRKVVSGGGTESSGGGTSTSSPIRTKRAAIVLTPLSAVIRRTRVSNGAANSGSPSVGTSPRRPNRKATRKEVG